MISTEVFKKVKLTTLTTHGTKWLKRLVSTIKEIGLVSQNSNLHLGDRTVIAILEGIKGASLMMLDADSIYLKMQELKMLQLEEVILDQLSPGTNHMDLVHHHNSPDTNHTD